MERVCIFCGQRPENKNKEHVLPRWLLELTGNPNRTVKIGFDWSTGKELSFSFDSLVFPSCKTCNDKYSKVEVEAKDIIHKIFQCEYLSTKDINTLLDWLDKVRIGLWIGNQYLSKNALGVEPKFYIDQRLRKTDRLLMINDFNNSNQGLTLIGVNNPFFHWSPTCFGMVINNKVFTNVSTDFIVSHNLGLPYPRATYVSSEHRMIEIELLKGKLKLNKRLFRYPFLKPYAILGQAIVSNDLMNHRSDLYNDEYIENSWQTGKPGLGKVFYEINGILDWLDEEDELQIDLRPFVKDGELRIDIQTIKFQNFIHETFSPSDEKLTLEHKKNYRGLGRIVREFNNNAIKDLKEKTTANASIAKSLPLKLHALGYTSVGSNDIK
jgi:hypothetical protein